MLYGIDKAKTKCAAISKKQDKYIKYDEFKIEHDKKLMIFNELENIGITKDKLFPEIDNYIDFIDRKFMDKIWKVNSLLYRIFKPCMLYLLSMQGFCFNGFITFLGVI